MGSPEIDELRKEYYKLGMEAMEQNKVQKAFGLFTMAAEKEPVWPEAIFRRAHMAYLKGDKWGAAEYAVQALELEPSLSDLFAPEGFTKAFVLSQLNSLACRRIEAKHHSAALAYLETALKLDPGYPMALLTMAETYVSMGDYHIAMDWLEKAELAAPGTAGEMDEYSCYAPLRPYIRYGNITGKERVYPSEAIEWLRNGQSLMEQGNNKRAVEAFDNALKLAVDWPEALFLRGMAKYLAGPNTGIVADLLLQADSVDDLAKAVDFNPEVITLSRGKLSVDSIASALNSRVCDEAIPQQQWQRGIADLKLCMRIHPAYVYPYLTMAELYVAAHNPDEAIHWLQQALAVDPMVKDKVDTYSCYAPLRDHPVYRELFVREMEPPKSYYHLHMFVEPGGMREYFQMVSGSAGHIREMIIARIKSGFGLYALLSYGQTIRVQRFAIGILETEVDILPFLRITVPNELTASFTEEGHPVIRNMEGNPIPEGDLAGLLFDYIAYEEEAETVILGDWETRLGALTGDVVSEQEEFMNGEGTVFKADMVYEEESGEEFLLADFLMMAKEGQG
ncbi:tetratricopeptide repeat protein [Gorillibacterium sp. sgz5001074]|uniref:tetratricopeptide repeat protein n=1 Tax=Gorillibacterium sp. sgz5001074 TaxID=3446695 RepID=UPI003F668EF1